MALERGVPKIALSYRRSDSDAIAGRIRDRLADYYGDDAIFMDIDNIPFGTNFREHVSEIIRDADLVLAVVGPKWLGRTKGGHTRISEEADPVRLELETALAHEKPVIPLLVSGAKMPRKMELPTTLQKFSDLNAPEVDTGRDFRIHMERVTHSIDAMLNRPSGPVARALRPRRFRIPIVWLGLAALAIAIGATIWAAYPFIATGGAAPTFPTTHPAADATIDTAKVSQWLCSHLTYPFDIGRTVSAFPLEKLPALQKTVENGGDVDLDVFTAKGQNYSLQYSYMYRPRTPADRFGFKLILSEDVGVPRPLFDTERERKVWLAQFGSPKTDVIETYVGVLDPDDTHHYLFKFAVWQRFHGVRAEWLYPPDARLASRLCQLHSE